MILLCCSVLFHQSIILQPKIHSSNTPYKSSFLYQFLFALQRYPLYVCMCAVLRMCSLIACVLDVMGGCNSKICYVTQGDKTKTLRFDTWVRGGQKLTKLALCNFWLALKGQTREQILRKSGLHCLYYWLRTSYHEKISYYK